MYYYFFLPCCLKNSSWFVPKILEFRILLCFFVSCPKNSTHQQQIVTKYWHENLRPLQISTPKMCNLLMIVKLWRPKFYFRVPSTAQQKKFFSWSSGGTKKFFKKCCHCTARGSKIWKARVHPLKNHNNNNNSCKIWWTGNYNQETLWYPKRCGHTVEKVLVRREGATLAER